MTISSWSRLLSPSAAPELLAPISHSYTAFVHQPHFLKRCAFSPAENQTLLWEFGRSQRSPSPHLSLHVTFPLNLVWTSMYLTYQVCIILNAALSLMKTILSRRPTGWHGESGAALLSLLLSSQVPSQNVILVFPRTLTSLNVSRRSIVRVNWAPSSTSVLQ
jgi:hypothetical protein